MTFIWGISKKKYIPTEAQEQIALADWLDLNKIPYYHVPNGGYRNEREAAKLKRMGTKPGVPDICIARANNGYHGAYIELKRKGGRLSSPQKIWLTLLKGEGYYTAIAYGATEAIEIIRGYLGR